AGDGGARPGRGVGSGGPLRGACPLPAPSRNRGSAPDPAPQAPEGLGGGAPSRAPLLKCRRGWVVGLRPGRRSSSAGVAGNAVARARPEAAVRSGPRGPAGYRSVLRRRNVRDRPSSSNGVPYVSSAPPSA
ncbi:hypothetical protein E6P78_17570, partial [Streptomyces sp. A0958]